MLRQDCHEFEADLGHNKFQTSLGCSITVLKKKGAGAHWGDIVQSIKLLL